MNNPFQDQLLKAGLVTKKQVQKAQQDKSKKHKQQRQQSKKTKTVDQGKLKAQRAAEEKAQRDRELNKQKDCLSRDENCDIVYNFEHNKKIKRIYVNADMKQQIIKGRLGIARIEGRYELVPQTIAEKIQQRNEKRVVLFDAEIISDENDPYAEHQIPDDLMW